MHTARSARPPVPPRQRRWRTTTGGGGLAAVALTMQQQVQRGGQQQRESSQVAWSCYLLSLLGSELVMGTIAMALCASCTGPTRRRAPMVMLVQNWLTSSHSRVAMATPAIIRKTSL